MGTIRIDKNNHGKFEVWEPGGCKNGHSALLCTVNSVKEGVDEVMRLHRTSWPKQKLSVRVVVQTADQAVLEYS